LTRIVHLKVSDLVDTPLALGLWKPVILVPASLFTGMTPELLEALLAHELAHIQRHDYLVNLLQSFVEVLLFYHPAVWWISRKVRTEREFLADERAARTLGEPRRLALALNALDDLQPNLPTPALAARGGHLMNRIHRLLRPMQDSRRGCTPLLWLAPALMAAALLTPLAAAVIQETQNEAVKIYAPASLVQKIDDLAKQEGIDPDLLRAIAWNESHFDPQAISRIGAKGILQVMPETALKFGATNLEDPDQVTRAGAHYLRHLLDTYPGDLTKVLSAYNGGEAAVESGQLSDETRHYAPAVLALLKARAVQPDDTIATPQGLPVPSAKVSSGYGPRKSPVGVALPNNFYSGIDLKSPQGTPVQATADGIVTHAGSDGDRGITVVLQHGGSVETLYSHLA
jgi:murein DD-endopeptidase MepM/ murein hydrolase activator NlpD